MRHPRPRASELAGGDPGRKAFAEETQIGKSNRPSSFLIGRRPRNFKGLALGRRRDGVIRMRGFSAGRAARSDDRPHQRIRTRTIRHGLAFVADLS